MNKKSQAAMEFLMTYGWAILVVLVVIGALAYFGVLKPTNFLPEKCEFPISLSCKNYVIKANQVADKGNIIFELTNGQGNDIRITRITAYSDTLKQNCTYYNGTSPEIGRLLRNGMTGRFYLNKTYQGIATNANCDIDYSYAGSSEKIKWALTVKWYPSSSTSTFSHTSNGDLMAKVEK